MQRWLLALTIVLLAVQPGWAAPSRPISKRQMRDQPQAQSSHQVMGQIADLFVTDAPKPSMVPTRVLMVDDFRTRPRGSDIKGMCQIDVLDVEFEPVRAGGSRVADTPTRAAGFTARRYYAFVDPPSAARMWEYTDSPRDTDCSETDFWKSGYFLAGSDTDAASGYRALVAFRAALAAGEVVPTCALFPYETERDCGKIFAALEPVKLDGLERCGRDYEPGQDCYRYSFWDREVTLVVKPRADNMTIVSAKLVTLMVMVHPLAD